MYQFLYPIVVLVLFGASCDAEDDWTVTFNLETTGFDKQHGSIPYLKLKSGLIFKTIRGTIKDSQEGNQLPFNTNFVPGGFVKGSVRLDSDILKKANYVEFQWESDRPKSETGPIKVKGVSIVRKSIPKDPSEITEFSQHQKVFRCNGKVLQSGKSVTCSV